MTLLLAPRLHEQISSTLSKGDQTADCDRSATTRLQETLNKAIPGSCSGTLAASKLAKADEDI
jgi:hypothetical protein